MVGSLSADAILVYDTDAVKRDNPDIRVLFIFISGYTAERIGSKGVVRNGVELLEKPFTPRALVRRARDILDRS